MALNIKNAAVEKLAEEVARLSGESKTEAIRKALEERKTHLVLHSHASSTGDNAFEFFASQVWPKLPRRSLGKSLTKEQRERILGYGPYGV